MLEKLPAAVGRAMSDVRPGLDAIMSAEPALRALPSTLRVGSTDFADGGPLPVESTADGIGQAPPLTWDDPPPGSAELVLLVEDADPPLPRPLVHLIVHGLPPRAGSLRQDLQGLALGTNSYLKQAWLPPDPPTGHGTHRYVFQLFALCQPAGLGDAPGRGAVRRVLLAHAIARGQLIGTYARP